jgi:antitoxin (DNA-binding transcriptional repressor) of toxin-antitoxin stability system
MHTTVQVGLDEAQKRLLDLIEAAMKGETVFIFKGKQEIVQLVPIKPLKRNPQFGSAKGLIEMTADFDAPLQDFEEYML